MIELKKDRLMFAFPQVHKDAVCGIEFQRTLRIPDDNRAYPLPPGLGEFPMEHVEDHVSRLPQEWAGHGGVLLPMYQAEALWIRFSAGHGKWSHGYPFAVKIAAGKIDAVTGGAWTNEIHKTPQDYVVIPNQPWLDGFCVQKGMIRQFVAMPLGQGYTAEEQLTGKAEHGGLQIIVYPMKRARYEELLRKREHRRGGAYSLCLEDTTLCAAAPSMGLAPGGLMRQEIYEDDYGFDAWDTTVSSRCFVHILNSRQWQSATGKAAPGKPPTAAQYSTAGLPWFDYYDETQSALSGSDTLAQLDSVAAKGVKKGEPPLPDNDAVNPKVVVKLGSPKHVGQGQW
jgi:hypothetical protein